MTSRICEWPECDEHQVGLMRFCEHHGHRILMGQDEPPEVEAPEVEAEKVRFPNK